MTEAAVKPGCTRQAFSPLLNGRTGISPEMALALARIGWSNATFWMLRQTLDALASGTSPSGTGGRHEPQDGPVRTDGMETRG